MYINETASKQQPKSSCVKSTWYVCLVHIENFIFLKRQTIKIFIILRDFYQSQQQCNFLEEIIPCIIELVWEMCKLVNFYEHLEYNIFENNES